MNYKINNNSLEVIMYSNKFGKKCVFLLLNNHKCVYS